MKKILLLNPPGDRLYQRDYYCSDISKSTSYRHPYDLVVFSGWLYGKHQIHVLDAQMERLLPAQCFDKISRLDIDVIIFLTGCSSWMQDAAFLKKIKTTKRIILIGSGDILLFEGENIMKDHQWLDAVSLDFTTPSILDYLKSAPGKIIPDFIVRQNDKIVRGPETDSSEFALPIPRHELFPLKKYWMPHIRKFPFASVLTTFGCFFGCPICASDKLTFKIRNIDNIMEELTYLKKIGMKSIYFRDSTFGANRRHSLTVCREMIKNKFNFSWSCHSRIDVLDEELLGTMKRAGAHLVTLGVESANESVLKKYKPGISLKQIEKTFELCRRFKVKTLAHFIVGLPGEDERSSVRMINFAREINPDFATFNIVMPKLGTRLREEALKNKWCLPELTSLDTSCTYPILETPALSRETIFRLRNQAIKQFYFRPGYIVKKIIEGIQEKKILMYVRESLAMVRNLKPRYPEKETIGILRKKYFDSDIRT